MLGYIPLQAKAFTSVYVYPLLWSLHDVALFQSAEDHQLLAFRAHIRSRKPFGPQCSLGWSVLYCKDPTMRIVLSGGIILNISLYFPVLSHAMQASQHATTTFMPSWSAELIRCLKVSRDSFCSTQTNSHEALASDFAVTIEELHL